MSPRTKRKTTKRRAKRTKRHAFWSYSAILLIAAIVGVATYFLLGHFYGKIDEKYSAIDKIEKYFNKQKQEKAAKDNVKIEPKSKFEPKPQPKIEPKQETKEPEIKDVKRSLETNNSQFKTTLKDLNLTDDEQADIRPTVKNTETIDMNSSVKDINFTKPKEQNLTKTNGKNGKIHIEIVEQNETKKDKKRSPEKAADQVGISDKKPITGKPKLVIIIDDVAYKHQVDAIKSINLKLTPSFFPSTKDHPDTPKFAKSFKFYMIHLPMQAHGFKKEEIGTLHVGDSYDKILKRIRDIKNDFPDLKYINNHTGSKFTSDIDAMNRLMRVVKSEELVFVDSKTIANSKVEQAALKHGMPYIARDVFLDHEDSKAFIKKQLKYAVELAKRNSYAIAIGHPHKNTLEVLKNSKELLQDVEVVYLKDIL